MTLRTASLSLLLFAASTAPVLAEIRAELITDDPVWAEEIAREARLAPKLSSPHDHLLLPYFEVDRVGTDGQNAIFAVRNPQLGSSTSGSITYYDVAGNARTIENFTLGAGRVMPRSLLLVPGLPTDPDGFSRGYVSVDTGDATKLSGDYFQIDAANDFATGSRMIHSDDLCLFWDARFLQGGGFDGGTTFQLFIANPAGVDPADPPSMTFAVYNEGGLFAGLVGIQTDQKVARLPMGAVIAALPGGFGPSFGSVWITFNPTGGHVQVSYDALGRYSVGLEGSCLSP